MTTRATNHCGRCKQDVPIEEFAPSHQAVTGAWCKPCRRAQWRETHGELPAECAHCHAPLEDVRDRRRKFCDNNCKQGARWLRKHPKLERACLVCNVDITDMRSDAKFCSGKCAWTERNSKETPESRRASKLWSNYKITPADYDAMLAAQVGRCAICLGNDPRSPHGFWHVDHCHDSLVVRGLLCGPCNTGIGQMQDDSERLERAAEYIRKANCAR
jgi:hypothetical protein